MQNGISRYFAQKPVVFKNLITRWLQVYEVKLKIATEKIYLFKTNVQFLKSKVVEQL